MSVSKAVLTTVCLVPVQLSALSVFRVTLSTPTVSVCHVYLTAEAVQVLTMPYVSVVVPVSI